LLRYKSKSGCSKIWPDYYFLKFKTMRNFIKKTQIWFYIIISISYSTLLTIWSYIIFIIIVLFLLKTTNSNIFYSIFDWFVLTLKTFFIMPINIYKTDYLWWIFFWVIIYWLILYSIFWKNSKFNFIFNILKKLKV
jgi:hypothetical protein